MTTAEQATGRRIDRLVRAEVQSLEEYQPVVPPEELAARVGVPVERIIKLDGNENPYGSSPRVARALAALGHYHVYPDPTHRELREQLAQYTGLGAEYIMVGNGSDEMIDLVARLVLGPGDRVLNCEPTFGMYRLAAGLCGAEIVDVPRDGNFGLDMPAIRQALARRAVKLVFLASPNNPTANTAREGEVIELLETGALVLVDEAYYEFSGWSVAHLVPRYDNLVVLRTFSKWAGLAGLRIGYALLSPALARHLWKIKPPYNVNVAALVAARESLLDVEYLRRTVKAILEERERLRSGLAALGYLKPWPSEANFIYCQVLQGRVRDLLQALARAGIFVRYFDRPRLRDGLRISVGLPEHTDALLQRLEEYGRQMG